MKAPSANCQVCGKYRLENERTISSNSDETNTAATLWWPASTATKTNSPDFVQSVKLGSTCPSTSAVMAPPMPPSAPQMVKLTDSDTRAEAPRYSTRKALARTAWARSPATDPL